jgi:hypothetical protein
MVKGGWKAVDRSERAGSLHLLCCVNKRGRGCIASMSIPRAYVGVSPQMKCFSFQGCSMNGFDM